MFHIVNTADRPADDAVLRAMFAARKSVFVDLLKWDVPVIEGRYEIDQFDDAHATYLILADRAGAHLGSARLLPTVRPHILGDLFPFLCEGAPPRGESMLEITRGSQASALRPQRTCQTNLSDRNGKQGLPHEDWPLREKLNSIGA